MRLNGALDFWKILTVLENVIRYKKKPRQEAGVSGYGEYTTITAVAGEPTEVAD